MSTPLPTEPARKRSQGQKVPGQASGLITAPSKRATECELLHTHGKLSPVTRVKGELSGNSTLNENQRRADAMHLAFRQACARLELTGSTPVIELVAQRIIELARAGECDPDRLTASAVSTFEG